MTTMPDVLEPTTAATPKATPEAAILVPAGQGLAQVDGTAVEAAVEVTCPTCAFAGENGWWGNIAPARTHCRGCHRFWGNSKGDPGPHGRGAGLREAHCAACHEHFLTPEAFYLHMTAAGCRPPAEVLRRDGKPKLAQRETRWGTAWAVAYYGERPSFWSQGTETTAPAEAA